MEETVKLFDEARALDGGAARSAWDAIVIGAGPAGALAARQIALAGMQTLLLDAKHFPREKVCGGYLSRRALEALRQAGLTHLALEEAETSVRQLELIRDHQRTHFRLPSGRVICRTTFDAVLVDAARRAGAEVRTGAQAAVERTPEGVSRVVTVVQDGRRETLDTRVVICADGLTRTSVRHLPEFAISTASDSRIGVGAVVMGDFDDCPMGQITMVVSRCGYVGISRVGEQLFNIAAAIDRRALLHTRPARFVADVLTDAGIRFPSDLASAHWRGTPPLTSRPKHVAAERVLLIGDAGGYIEPFTGEGMAFALEAAMLITPLVVEAVQTWTPAIAQRWETLHRQMVRDRQQTCQQLAWILRRPWAASLTLGFCRMMPGIAERMIERTSYPTNLSRPTGMGAT